MLDFHRELAASLESHEAAGAGGWDGDGDLFGLGIDGGGDDGHAVCAMDGGGPWWC